MNPIDRIEQLRAECIALRTRVADYEERLSAVMPSDFKDWNQNARSEWPEVAARVIQSLVEREHFANGTAELASHHRDIAEQRNDELEAALEELYETASSFPTFDGSRLASALDSASAALAESATPDKPCKHCGGAGVIHDTDIDGNITGYCDCPKCSATPAKHPDTETVDWLEDNTAVLYCAGLYDRSPDAAVEIPGIGVFVGETLRAAIDAARKALAESATPLPMREDPRYRGTDFRSAIDVDRASQGGGK